MVHPGVGQGRGKATHLARTGRFDSDVLDGQGLSRSVRHSRLPEDRGLTLNVFLMRTPRQAIPRRRSRAPARARATPTRTMLRDPRGGCIFPRRASFQQSASQRKDCSRRYWGGRGEEVRLTLHVMVVAIGEAEIGEAGLTSLSVTPAGSRPCC